MRCAEVGRELSCKGRQRRNKVVVAVVARPDSGAARPSSAWAAVLVLQGHVHVDCNMVHVDCNKVHVAMGDQNPMSCKLEVTTT